MNQQQEKTWLGRNWKWVIPVGCFASVAILTGFIAFILYFVFSMMKSSDAYKDAVVKAKANPSVQQSIGTPIEEGLFVFGNITVNGSSGHADLSIPIKGPDGKATIYLVAEKSAGKWSFSTLVVEISKTKVRINLIEQEQTNGSSLFLFPLMHQQGDFDFSKCFDGISVVMKNQLNLRLDS